MALNQTPWNFTGNPSYTSLVSIDSLTVTLTLTGFDTTSASPLFGSSSM
ncbi:MAG TPA: hypothetical protein VE959_32175 [Bryobacteraceae bacterium]|nr:hypothetical protein [Bryobacteraceae bacterium]